MISLFEKCPWENLMLSSPIICSHHLILVWMRESDRICSPKIFEPKITVFSSFVWKRTYENCDGEKSEDVPQPTHLWDWFPHVCFDLLATSEQLIKELFSIVTLLAHFTSLGSFVFHFLIAEFKKVDSLFFTLGTFSTEKTIRGGGTRQQQYRRYLLVH